MITGQIHRAKWNRDHVFNSHHNYHFRKGNFFLPLPWDRWFLTPSVQIRANSCLILQMWWFHNYQCLIILNNSFKPPISSSESLSAMTWWLPSYSLTGGWKESLFTFLIFVFHFVRIFIKIYRFMSEIRDLFYVHS